MNSAGKSASRRFSRILSVQIADEQDIVTARHRTRQLAALVGLATQDQVALATAVSELARNIQRYAKEGQVDFQIDLQARPQFFAVHVHDQGPGIHDLDGILEGRYQSTTGMGLGIVGTRKITDEFRISSTVNGTSIQFGKFRPVHLSPITTQDLKGITLQLTNTPPSRLPDELRQIEHELAQTLSNVQERETELERKTAEMGRLNLELEETNRGVVALYAELEDRAAALRRADELKSRFLSHVTHEFRTPVNSVMALARLLLRRTDGNLTSEQEKQVSFILKAAEGLTEMVDDLLDLAKMEAGKIEVHKTTFELHQALGAVRALMRPLATNEAVSLVFVEGPAGLTIHTDEAKLGQILRNLVSNALKFTEQGEVRIEASHDAVDDVVSLSVTDTGIGLSPEDQERVFQEFSQVSSHLQRSVKGTGLGLPLSRRLAELLGGTLTVVSALNKGSTFTLRLPRHTVSEPTILNEDVKSSYESTVLIVDDEETSLYVCRHMFQGSSHRIIEANALDAAERARFERPDLIILDLMMPGRTGFDILDELRSDSSTKQIPVVIHTSKSITEADLYRLNSQMIGILSKSGRNRRAVLEAIRGVLNDNTLFVNEPEFQ